MDILDDFAFKQKKYIPVFQKRLGHRLFTSKAIRLRTMNLWQQPDFTGDR